VTRVEIWKDSSLFTTLTNVSYTQWDTTKETNGSHTLQAKAYDAANNIGLSPAVTVNIQNATTTGTGGGGGSNTKSKKKKKSKTSPIFTQDLALGSQGSDVSRLQTLLSEDPSLYPEQMITGFYGPKTTEAIKRFQAQYGLPVSGRLDQATRAKIAEIFETTEGPTVTTIPEPQPTQTTNQSSLLQEQLRRLQLQLIQLLQEQVKLLQEQVKLLQNKIKTPR
jgi:peptidoglycan hydrolase-like protein with peptidoglycan-binding domain